MNTDSTRVVKPHRSKVRRGQWLRSVGIVERHRFYRIACAYCDTPGRIRLNKGYCTTGLADDPNVCFAVDHVVPLSRGGADDGSNFAFTCNRCNSRKGNRSDWTSPNGALVLGRWVVR